MQASDILARLGGEDHDLQSRHSKMAALSQIRAAIDRWVVQAPLVTLSRHPQQRSHLAYCLINLSGQSIGRENFLTFLDQTLDQSPVDPGKL